MPIEFSCGNCQSKLRTPDDTAGKAARCPNCGNLEAIPDIPNSDFPTASPVVPTQVSSAKPVPNPFGVRPDQQNESSPYAAPAYAGQQAYRVVNRQTARNKLMPAVITLLVLNSIGILLVMMAMLGGFMSLAENGNNSEDIGLLIVCGFWALFHFIGLVGCISILRMRSYWLGMTGIICSIIAGIPCCFAPTGFGIWALVVILDSDVKRFIK